jgi:hypothetical protein
MSVQITDPFVQNLLAYQSLLQNFWQFRLASYAHIIPLLYQRLKFLL